MKNKSTILITGGTGLIGSALSRLLLEKGYDVIILSRGAARAGYHTAHWDPAKQIVDPEAIQAADYIIHLAGAGIADKRWTAQRKKEIVESRTSGSALIVKALNEVPNKVQAVISVSGIGWYGADPLIPNPHPFVETDPADTHFLGETCRLWETGIEPVSGLGKRLVIFRTGVVLSREGGALAEFSKPVRFGVAAILGSGRQVLSWIHIDDLCRLFIEAVENEAWQGVYNAVAPWPIDNKTFTRELATRMKGRFFVPVYVPSFILKLVVGGLSIEVLKSSTVSVEKIRQTGFQFIYPSIESALKDLI